MEGPDSVAATASWRVLDLFCGAGGISEGYSRLGASVVGVDLHNQPRYPFTFIRGDWRDVLEAWWLRGSFDLIHASPPCQHYSDLAYRNGNADQSPDLIGPVRELLQEIGTPYVIENVEGAPLRRDRTVMLCGSMFGLGVDGYRLRRHRLFEFSWTPPALLGTNCKCLGDTRPVIDVSGGGPTHASRLDGGGGRTYKGTVAQKRAAMGIDWMTGGELVEAIPPAYAEWVGAQFLAARDREEVAA